MLPLDEYTKIIGRDTEIPPDIRVMTDMSKAWFRQEAIRLRKIRFNRNKFIISNGKEVKQKIVIGRLYMFEYYPKGEGKLPVWDRFPLCLPFTGTADGFYGINLHYLTYWQRAFLLEKLVKASGVGITPLKDVPMTKRMKVSWEILNSFSRVPVAEHATKQYLLSQIQSPFKLIPFGDYSKAIMMPMAEFYGENANKFKNRY